MPIYLNGKSSNHEPLAPEPSGRCLHIGLINNMADAALEATERQFHKLLDEAADDVLVRLSFFALPDVPRNQAGRRHIRHSYSGFESLWTSQLDGLIVTGREPRTPNLKDEPYWENLTKVVDWAKENTHSTVWSCLAGHAALLHLDGIARRKSNQKRCGVLECERLSDHALLEGVPLNFKVPHSRWNDISESELTARGYSALTRAQDAGVDAFVKRHPSLFVFFQGHPEYESDTLLLEYRRDVRRYLRGETDTYPSIPQAYFDEDTADALTALQEKAVSGRRDGLLEDLAATMGKSTVPNTWHSTARCVYRNWLKYIGRQKETRSQRSQFAVNCTAEELVHPPL